MYYFYYLLFLHFIINKTCARQIFVVSGKTDLIKILLCQQTPTTLCVKSSALGAQFNFRGLIAQENGGKFKPTRARLFSYLQKLLGSSYLGGGGGEFLRDEKLESISTNAAKVIRLLLRSGRVMAGEIYGLQCATYITWTQSALSRIYWNTLRCGYLLLYYHETGYYYTVNYGSFPRLVSLDKIERKYF